VFEGVKTGSVYMYI